MDIAPAALPDVAVGLKAVVFTRVASGKPCVRVERSRAGGEAPSLEGCPAIVVSGLAVDRSPWPFGFGERHAMVTLFASKRPSETE